jgi:excisionase family DNA binding protein
MTRQLSTISDAASRFSVKPSGLRQWIRDGKVAVVRLGRLVRISEEEIERVMREGIAST